MLSVRTHLIVFVHGLNGSGRDFDNMVKVVTNAIDAHDGASGRRTRIHCTTCNAGLVRTCDGIVRGGLRLAQELREVAASTDPGGGALDLSLVGHSLGGMYLRYALHVLHRENDPLVVPPLASTVALGEPSAGVNGSRRVALRLLVTLATPHLGIRGPWVKSPFNAAFQFSAANLPGMTSAHDLCLTEKREKDEPPLLVTMATDEAFLAPLRRFHRRLLYSNVVNDFQVSFETAAMLPANPYEAKGGQPAWPTAGAEDYPSITAVSLALAATLLPANGQAQPPLPPPPRAGGEAGANAGAGAEATAAPPHSGGGGVCDRQGSLAADSAARDGDRSGDGSGSGDFGSPAGAGNAAGGDAVGRDAVGGNAGGRQVAAAATAAAGMELAAMLGGLAGEGSGLCWERYDVHFAGSWLGPVKAHEWIVGKNAHQARGTTGWDVCGHLAATIAADVAEGGGAGGGAGGSCGSAGAAPGATAAAAAATAAAPAPAPAPAPAAHAAHAAPTAAAAFEENGRGDSGAAASAAKGSGGACGPAASAT